METGKYKIRPSARLISAIGENLIGDVHSALVELVKNAYDADASYVNIIFQFYPNGKKDALHIEIEDNGHGMTRDTIINKWLVPATNDKIIKKSSPKGRLFQGRKGIGRYAAAILGQEFFLRSTALNLEETSLTLDWDDFNKIEFLEDIDIEVSTKESDKGRIGTVISIIAKNEKLHYWTEPEIEKLTNELRKLKSPLSEFFIDKFDINLAFFNCPYKRYNDQIFEIESYPIVQYYDYRIEGTVSENGELNASYTNKTEENIPYESIKTEIKLQRGYEYCGPIYFDLRVFDRDPESIDNLINKGLIDPISKKYLSKSSAKELLNEAYGINLYREGFRIRPYGNGGIDWLELDKKRIQDPSFKISNNQVVGFVNIKPEEISHLEEKSARDGLKENEYYKGLTFILSTIINELEERRYSFRKKTGRGRRKAGLQKELTNLFDYDDLFKSVNKKLSFHKIGENVRSEVSLIIKEEAKKKNEILEDIQKTVAIYQGQATLGKIITVLLHEGRKPVNYFKQQSPMLSTWLNIYKGQKDWEDQLFYDLLDRLKNFKDQSILLATLFKRLDPLAKQNKGDKNNFSLNKAINKSFQIFENELQEKGIIYDFKCDTYYELYGWEEDVIIALTNLIENSIYWLGITSHPDKLITVSINRGNGILVIHYQDNGPGISKHNIESGIIFEPGFSKKNGTGIGLPIAGEAIERLDGSLSAHYSENGAYFTIEIPI